MGTRSLAAQPGQDEGFNTGGPGRPSNRNERRHFSTLGISGAHGESCMVDRVRDSRRPPES
jgi:hypothetical protein